MGLLRDYEPSCGPSFEALVTTCPCLCWVSLCSGLDAVICSPRVWSVETLAGGRCGQLGDITLTLWTATLHTTHYTTLTAGHFYCLASTKHQITRAAARWSPVILAGAGRHTARLITARGRGGAGAGRHNDPARWKL